MLAHEKTYRLVRPAPRFSERAFPDPDRGRANVSVKRGGLTFPLVAFRSRRASRASQQADFAATPASASRSSRCCARGRLERRQRAHRAALQAPRAAEAGDVARAGEGGDDVRGPGARPSRVKAELIETLGAVTSGRSSSRWRSARLTRQLARIKEDAGKPEEAADIMQEVAVETYGALSKHEKVFFIEEQVRLCLDKNDHVRAQILSRKINPRSFDEIVKSEKKAALEAARKAGEDVRQMDLDAAAAHDARRSGEGGEGEERQRRARGGVLRGDGPEHPAGGGAPLELLPPDDPVPRARDDYLEMCRCYQNVMACDLVKRTTRRCDAAMPPSARRGWWRWRRSPMQQRPAAPDQQGRAPGGPAAAQAAHEAVHDEGDHPLGHAGGGVCGGDCGGDGAVRRREGRGAAGGFTAPGHRAQPVGRGRRYKRVRLERLGELLCLDAKETEKRLSDLVVAKKVSARIDRLGGVVDFNPEPRGADWLLNQWVGKVDKLLDVLDKSNHLIHKEAMAHKVSPECARRRACGSSRSSVRLPSFDAFKPAGAGDAFVFRSRVAAIRARRFPNTTVTIVSTYVSARIARARHTRGSYDLGRRGVPRAVFFSPIPSSPRGFSPYTTATNFPDASGMLQAFAHAVWHFSSASSAIADEDARSHAARHPVSHASSRVLNPSCKSPCVAMACLSNPST